MWWIDPAKPRTARLEAAIEELYRVFASFERPATLELCTYCHDPAVIALIHGTALRDLGPDHTRTLLWETGDHWPSTEVYKHYLPRLLESLAPPMALLDLYPAHVFETLEQHGFSTWPDAERSAASQFFDALEELMREEDGGIDPGWESARASAEARQGS